MHAEEASGAAAEEGAGGTETAVSEMTQLARYPPASACTCAMHCNNGLVCRSSSSSSILVYHILLAPESWFNAHVI